MPVSNQYIRQAPLGIVLFPFAGIMNIKVPKRTIATAPTSGQDALKQADLDLS